MINLEKLDTFWGTGKGQLPPLPKTIYINMEDCPTEKSFTKKPK